MRSFYEFDMPYIASFPSEEVTGWSSPETVKTRLGSQWAHVLIVELILEVDG